MSNVAPDGSLELSVAETNKLRAQLGLKPLKESAVDEAVAVAPVLASRPTTDDLRRRLSQAKSHRAREQILKEGRSLLGEIIAEGDALLDPGQWLKSMQNTQTVEPQNDPEPDEASSEANAENLRIAHQLDRLKFNKGETVAFTLKDTTILDESGNLKEYGENEAVYDYIENEEIRETERRAKQKRERKFGGYDPSEGQTRMEDVDDLDSIEKTSEEPPDRILPHYDQWAVENKTLKKDPLHDYKASTSIAELENLPEHRQVDLPNVITLTSVKGIQKDYYTPEECRAVCFKHPVKVNRKVKRQRLKIEENLTETAPLEFLKPADGSRSVIPIHAQNDNDDDERLYEQLAKHRVARLPVKSETDPKSVTVKQEVVDMVSQAQTAQLSANFAEGIKSVGVVDIKQDEASANLPSSMELSSATEFCRAVMTPLERLQDGQLGTRFAQKRSHRGFAVQSATRHPNLSDDEAFSPTSRSQSDDDEGGLTAEEREKIQIILNEDLLDGGLASALNYLKSRGQLNSDGVLKKGYRGEEHQPLHISTKPGDIKLEYKDDYGKIMTPKEAFRYISWVFHGKGPGKRKREKMLRKMEMDKKKKLIGSNPNQLPTMIALKRQPKRDKPYLVLSALENNNA